MLVKRGERVRGVRKKVEWVSGVSKKIGGC